MAIADGVAYLRSHTEAEKVRSSGRAIRFVEILRSLSQDDDGNLKVA